MNFSFVGRSVGCCCLVVAALATFMTSGCGGGSKGNVTGTVKFDGQPLPTGTITFQTQHDVIHADIKDGKYTIPNVEVGPVKVAVETHQTGVMGPSLSGAPVAPKADAGKFVPIPAKYANVESSTLTYEVKAGENTKDFDLAP